MKQEISIDELQSCLTILKENAAIIGEIKSIKGINETLSKIESYLNNKRDENSYKNNYFMVRLKNETSIGYQAMERLIEMRLINYDENHFDFRCDRKGTIASFFSYVDFNESGVLSEYVTHKGNTIDIITFRNAKKNTETKEWAIIENILNNLNLTSN